MEPDRTLRRLIVEAVEPVADEPLLLSGGVDSATVLAAMLSMGKRPECFTFRFGQYDSEDVRVAASMCRHFGLPHHVVTVPRDDEAMERDIREMIRIIGCRPLKTHIQCGIPFMYLARAVAAAGASRAVTALTADDCVGSGKEALLARAHHGEEGFYRRRLKDCENPQNSYFSCVKAAAKYGVELAAVFRNEPLRKHLLGMTYEQLHKPKVKWGLVKAFPEFWSQGSWWRPNKNLQVVSGIRDAHDLLLKGRLNKRGHKAVVGIYGDIFAGRV